VQSHTFETILKKSTGGIYLCKCYTWEWPYLKLFNKSTWGNVYVNDTHENGHTWNYWINQLVRKCLCKCYTWEWPYLKLLDKSTGGNVYVNVTHENGHTWNNWINRLVRMWGNVHVNVTHKDKRIEPYLKLYWINQLEEMFM
jgi:hypothetical protein